MDNVSSICTGFSVYLGHVDPENTYWYLSGTPELLRAASARFESQPMEGGSNQ
jgi:hypothetical protein